MANNLMRPGNRRALSRFDPFSNFEDMFRDMSLMPALRGWDMENPIRLDISEDEKNYLVKADLPGVKKDDINISIDGNQVTVSAEIKEEKEEREKGMIRSERYVGQQYRSFALPNEVDEANAQAKYENGVLQLTLPKKSGSSRKQVPVQ
ncbi:MAG: Hsp20/alpha crystallin family protein [Burkholderiaceae bacterium]